MSTLLRCPRCKSEIDASQQKPGSIIKCAHCRGDMRIPEETKQGGHGMGSGRQSTLFRRMSNATVPGQHGPSAPRTGYADPRGASGRGRDLGGLYVGGGIVALIGVIIVIGVLMKGGGAEPTGKTGRKKETRAPVEAPPPPPPPPPIQDLAPNENPAGPPSSWEPDAIGYVLQSVKPVPSEPGHEKEGLELIKAKNSAQINLRPFRYLPFAINALISEDRELALAACQILYSFCEERGLRDSKDKNPIDMSWVNSAKYRGYIYSHWSTTWWPQSSSKLPDAPGNQDAVNRIDWKDMTRRLRGGGYHDPTTPQGAALKTVRNLGKATWPKLAELIDDEELGRTAAQILTELTGEKKPLPTEQNRTEVKNAWLAWIAAQK